MKITTTVSTLPDTPENLRALAKSLGIYHTRGVGASLEAGSISGLLDHIAQLVKTHGIAAITRRLEEDK